MKKITLISALCFIQQFCLAQPRINSFAPQAALPLSSVTISGSGFSATADSNIVFFGPVKGKVLNATANILTVQVPVGATYTFLSITKGRLIGYSDQFFTPLSNAAGYPIDNSSFKEPFTIAGNTAKNTESLKVYDADGDGKTDFIVIDTGSSSISFYRNITAFNNAGIASFAAPTFRNIGETQYDGNNPFIIADFDRDGKKDLAIDDTLMKIFKNTTSGLNISFNDSSGILPGKHFKGIAAGDIDGDGKTDLACIAYHSINFYTDTLKIKIFQNATGADGVINLAPLPDLLTHAGSNQGSSLSLIDFNNDGKADIFFNTWNYISGQYYYDYFTAINTSTIGNISFAPLLSFSGSPSIEQIRFADVDNDGLTDILTCNGHGKMIAVLRNISTLSSIAFAAPVNIAAGRSLYDFEISDLDGDGKVDIACIAGDWEPRPEKKLAIIFKNLSTPGNVSFSSKVEYNIPGFPSSIAAVDFDGDGRQDLVIGLGFFDKGIIILMNNIGTPVKNTLCPSIANYSLQSSLTGNNYQWQLSTDSINFLNLDDNTNYSGSHTSKLVINNSKSSMYGYRYRCLTDGKFDIPKELIFKNTWIGSMDSTWENAANWSCNTPPDGNTDVIIFSGNVVVGSDANCRSISVSRPGSFAVLPGFTLTVTH